MQAYGPDDPQPQLMGPSMLMNEAGSLRQSFKAEPLAPIEPLIRRHAEDAAFYWRQHDPAVDSPRLTLQGLGRFSKLLAAHLDGLMVAGEHGLRHANASLGRWRTASEAFVLARLALADASQTDLSATLWSSASKDPAGLLRGVISATLWLPPEAAQSWVHQWSLSDSDHAIGLAKIVAALRVCCHLDAGAWELANPLPSYLQQEQAQIRAAAWRLLPSVVRHSQQMPAARMFEQGMTDADLCVRAECAIACWLSHGIVPERSKSAAAWTALTTLRSVVMEQLGVLAAASGWHRQQAGRRLYRWVRHLALMEQEGDSAEEMLNRLPDPVALEFILQTGDPVHLPALKRLMSQPQQARRAAWIWQSITGVDLSAAGLVRAEPQFHIDDLDQPVTPGQADADLGLPLPDAQAVASVSTAHLRPGVPHLYGKPFSMQRALWVLETAPQAMRRVAAFGLLHHAGLRVPLAAHAVRQRAWLHKQGTHEPDRCVSSGVGSSIAPRGAHA